MYHTAMLLRSLKNSPISNLLLYSRKTQLNPKNSNPMSNLLFYNCKPPLNKNSILTQLFPNKSEKATERRYTERKRWKKNRKSPPTSYNTYESTPEQCRCSYKMSTRTLANWAFKHWKSNKRRYINIWFT